MCPLSVNLVDCICKLDVILFVSAGIISALDGLLCNSYILVVEASECGNHA